MQNKLQYQMGFKEWALLIFLSILWGGSFFFSKIALRELQPFTIVFTRVSLAAILLNGVLLATGQRLPGAPKRWAGFLLMGALNNAIPFSLIFWGQTQISSGLASILNATTPLWTILLAHLLTRDERLTVNKVGGVLFGILGVTTLIGWDLFKGIQGNAWAQLAVVGAAVSYAFAGIFAKRLKETKILTLAAGQLTCSSILMLPITLIIDRPWTQSFPSITVIGAMLSLVVLSTALAYILYFRLLAVAGATNALLVTFLIPVSALTLGIVILHEVFTVSQFIGMSLIGFGLVLMDGRVLARLRRRGNVTASNLSMNDQQL
jgi:drug/metabolite transporter (DMT)-like permease